MGGDDDRGGEKGGEAAKAVPFEAVRDPAWAAAIDDWVWLRGENRSEKMGKCPRCRHPVTFVDTALVYARFSVAQPIEGKSRKYAACDCSVAHPGAPAGQGGCGANGLIERPA
jgi:hypothetical protein